MFWTIVGALTFFFFGIPIIAWLASLLAPTFFNLLINRLKHVKKNFFNYSVSLIAIIVWGTKLQDFTTTEDFLAWLFALPFVIISYILIARIIQRFILFLGSKVSR